VTTSEPSTVFCCAIMSKSIILSFIFSVLCSNCQISAFLSRSETIYLWDSTIQQCLTIEFGDIGERCSCTNSNGSLALRKKCKLGAWCECPHSGLGLNEIPPIDSRRGSLTLYGGGRARWHRPISFRPRRILQASSSPGQCLFCRVAMPDWLLRPIHGSAMERRRGQCCRCAPDLHRPVRGVHCPTDQAAFPPARSSYVHFCQATCGALSYSCGENLYCDDNKSCLVSTPCRMHTPMHPCTHACTPY
jgi:hypothetical protein